MFKQIQRHRISTAIALAAAGIAVSFPATGLAQEQEFVIEEIVVTAQKREQSLQDVSMSLSAFTGVALEERVIEDLSDLQFSVPNLLADSVRVAIRGVGQNAISSTAEQGLGYHLNGVYLNRALARSSEYFDVERIEVLRGPQGTLYGRNTTAGVINILTRKPTDELGGYVTLAVGDYESFRLKGALNIPLGDNVRQRFAGSYLTREGYIDNIYTGNDIDGRDQYELRSSTSFDLGENTTFDLVISYLNEDSDRASESKGTCTKDPLTGCSPLSAGFETPDVSNSLWQILNGIAGGVLYPAGDLFADALNPPNYLESNVDQEPTYEVEQLGASLEINHEFGDYKFTSLTGYVDTESDIFQDFDRFATDVPLNFPVTYRANARDVETTDIIKSGRRDAYNAEQLTQELRIASDYDGNFNFMLGAFYYEENYYGRVFITHPSMAFIQQAFGLPNTFESFDVQSDPLETESLALFGEGYFDVRDDTRLTVGLRYTDDEKKLRTRQFLLFLVNSDWAESKEDWQEVTGKVTVEHSLNDDSMVFATLARGYKAGGFNPQTGTNFEPEFINQFEVGTKNTFADGRLRANFGVFYYDYEDLQIGQVNQTSADTVNTDSTVMGAEGEFNFLATDALEFDLNVSWLDLEINDFVSADEGDPNGIAPGTVQALDANGNPLFSPSGLVVKDLDGNALRNAPEFSLKFGAQYTGQIADGYELTGRIDHFWQDDYYANEFNKPSDELDSWSQTDVQLLLTPMASNWYLKAYSKNVFDNDDVIRRGQDGPLVGRFRSVTVLEPRTVGLELNLNFE
jgi:outer membrane receptor protein involved in Fe transport